MAKQQIHRGEHVLIRLRKIIGARIKEAKAVFGIAPDTFKSITSGRSKFSYASASIVAEKLGCSLDCLLENKTPVSASGKPYTRKFYESRDMAKAGLKIHNRRTAGGRALHWQRILSLKVARALIAASMSGQADLAFYRLRRAVESVGADFPKFNSPQAQAWDDAIQTEFNSIPNTPGNRAKKAAVIWQRFEREICNVVQAENSRR